MKLIKMKLSIFFQSSFNNLKFAYQRKMLELLIQQGSDKEDT